MTVKKYRPYFSLPELKELQSLVHSKNRLSPLSRYLDKYILEIEAGHRDSSLTLKPTLEQELGFDESAKIQTDFEKQNQSRYEQGLMSPEEELTYLRSIGVPI